MLPPPAPFNLPVTVLDRDSVPDARPILQRLHGNSISAPFIERIEIDRDEHDVIARGVAFSKKRNLLIVRRQEIDAQMRLQAPDSPAGCD